MELNWNRGSKRAKEDGSTDIFQYVVPSESGTYQISQASMLNGNTSCIMGEDETSVKDVMYFVSLSTDAKTGEVTYTEVGMQVFLNDKIEPVDECVQNANAKVSCSTDTDVKFNYR
jgi:hypothetical protein